MKTQCCSELVPTTQPVSPCLHEQACLTIDGQGMIRSMNGAAATFFGVAYVDEPLTNLVGATEYACLLQLLHCAMQGFPAQHILSWQTRAGKRDALLTLLPFDRQADTISCLLWPPLAVPEQPLQDKVQAIFENDLECVMVVDLDGRLVEINPAGLSLMEAANRSDMIGFKCALAVHPEDKLNYDRLAALARSGSTHRAEFRIFNLKGNLKWMDVKAVPLTDKEGKVYNILMMGHDITSRKHMEEGLRLSRMEAEENAAKMLAITESIHGSLFTINAAGRLEYFNRNSAAAAGVDGLHMIGCTLEELMEAANAMEFLETYQEALREQQHKHFEAYYHHRSMWVEVSIYPANGGIVVYFRDISDRKAVEQQIARNEQKLKALVHNGSDIIGVLNEQMQLQYLSPNSERIAGYAPAELLGSDLGDYIHPEDWERLLAEFYGLLDQRIGSNETSHRFLHKNGHYIWLETKANMLSLEGTINVIINSRDITHHKELEARLALEVQCRQKEVTNAVIRAQERERSQLGQELHDNVNQVLTTVKLYNEMILEGLGEGKDILPRSIQHLQSCITEIRSISKRLSAPTLGKICLQDSVGELVDSVNLTNRIRISYIIEGIQDIKIAEELHLALYRIIQEQLNNTLKYANASRMSVHIWHDPTGLHLLLEDDGQGFDLTQKRTGIGITNMKTRAENLNGCFSIYSAPGKGCRVQVRFPPLTLDAGTRNGTNK